MNPNLEKLIVVHPHVEFDGSRKVKDTVDNAIANYNQKNKFVLVVQGFKELSGHVKTNQKLPLYLRKELKYHLVQSEGGEISASTLDGIIIDNSIINLMGGIIGQCHRSAFESIVNYIQTNGIRNVTFIMPFDGCYFQHSWTEWGYSWERAKDPAKYRFDGVLMGGYGYEMEGGDSYSLREVITKKFGELCGPNNLHRKQLRDMNSAPIVASSDEVLINALNYFFHGYFMAPRDEPIVKRAYKTKITDFSFEVHIQ